MSVLDDLKIDQEFYSQSKIQKTPIKYIFKGKLKNGLYEIRAANGDPELHCQVFPEWFENRTITIFA
jgi:hypothetical protein